MLERGDREGQLVWMQIMPAICEQADTAARANVRLLGFLALLMLLVSCTEGPPQLHGYPTEAECLVDQARYDSVPLPDFIKRLFVARQSLIVKETALYPCGEAATIYRQEWQHFYGTPNHQHR